MRIQESIFLNRRATRFISENGAIEIDVTQEQEWIDEKGNVQRGYREPKISMGGRYYSPCDALQILFMLSAALELCQKWAEEDAQ